MSALAATRVDPKPIPAGTPPSFGWGRFRRSLFICTPRCRR
jgi:hypothetical protein